MRSNAAFLALLSAAALGNANPLLQHRAVCNADNCARAVTGTNPVTPLATRRADCSSFLLATVTPAPSTSTVTVTPAPVLVTTVATVIQTVFVGTSTTIFIGDPSSAATALGRRQASGGAVTNSPTAVPAYASACSGTARYSSACSCFGITKSTTTVPASTTTTTTTLPTVTSTVTVTSVETSTVVTGPLATATVVPGTRPACGSTIQGAGACGCTYTVTCNAAYSGGRIIETLRNVSEMECVNSCDNFDNCFDVDYSRTTGVCNIYTRAENMVTVNDDDAYAFAGTCTTSGGAPGCVVG